MKKKHVKLPHAVIFIHDQFANIQVPDKIQKNIVCFTASCISVWGTHEVDGKTLIVISEKEPVNQLHNVFAGQILTTSCFVSVTNSESQILLTAKAPSQTSTVSIFVDDLRSPSIVHIQVEP